MEHHDRKTTMRSTFFCCRNNGRALVYPSWSRAVVVDDQLRIVAVLLRVKFVHMKGQVGEEARAPTAVNALRNEKILTLEWLGGEKPRALVTKHRQSFRSKFSE